MRSIYRSTLMAAGLAGALFGEAAMAASPPSTGLGQTWPNAADVSASPHYHVYVFQKQGVRFVQVNDTNGTVRGAVAYTASDSVLDLPIGVDASRWVIPADDAGTAADTTGEQVYRDEAVIIHVAPQPDGTARLMLAPGCDDPLACSIRFQ